MNSRALTSTMIAAAALVSSAVLIAGPLTPPAGAPASTYKTLQEVEPRIAVNATNTPGTPTGVFRITQPGSYYLTDNLLAVPGKHGIEIVTGGVTLDLNGFGVIGIGSDSFDGIRTALVNPIGSIVIRNGFVRQWGGDGIEISATDSEIRVENVRSTQNAIGINCSGLGRHAIVNCVASENVSAGIFIADYISGCSATGNGSFGIKSDFGGVIVDSIAVRNGGPGFSSVGGTVSRCMSSSNANGYEGGSTTFDACTAYSNNGDGFTVSASVITGSTASNNTGNGFSASGSATITDCVAAGNDGNGFLVNASANVQRCTARLNGLNGIQAGSAGIIMGNQCGTNGQAAAGGAGILITGIDTRVEGNNVTTTDRGIQVTGTGNIIVRNTCSGNTTDWVIAANNIYGPIIDRRIPTTVPSTPAVSGPAATGTLGSADPNANFTY